MLVYQRVNFMDLSHQKGSLSDENWGEPWHMCIFTSKNIIWLVVWNMTFIFHILWIIIPTDELIFFRGVGRYTTNQLSIKKGAFTIKNWFLNIWILSRSFGLNQQTWVFVHENWGFMMIYSGWMGFLGDFELGISWDWINRNFHGDFLSFFMAWLGRCRGNSIRYPPQRIASPIRHRTRTPWGRPRPR